MTEEKGLLWDQLVNNKRRCRKRTCNADMSDEKDMRIRYCKKCRGIATQVTDDNTDEDFA